MSRIVSWTKFCEWMQGKKVLAENDVASRTILIFDDQSRAVVFSGASIKFGETIIEPPMVEITEKP